jgi:arginyl-tRNA synthetase
MSVENILPLIQLAPDNVPWDLAFPCFQFSKTLKKAPNQIATELESSLNGNKDNDLFSFQAVGPYLNATLNNWALAKDVIETVTKWGGNFWKWEATWKTILLEGWAPNTHKSIHIWHIRNFLLSESISRVLSFAGNKVIKTCYPWDIWAHVAKWLWYYTNFSNEKFPEHNFTKWVWEIYTLATRKIDEVPDTYKPQVEKLQKDLEDWDEKLVALWKETRTLCLEDMKHIFAELWTEHLDKRYYESEVEKPWVRIVHE